HRKRAAKLHRRKLRRKPSFSSQMSTMTNMVTPLKRHKCRIERDLKRYGLHPFRFTRIKEHTPRNKKKLLPKRLKMRRKIRLNHIPRIAPLVIYDFPSLNHLASEQLPEHKIDKHAEMIRKE